MKHVYGEKGCKSSRARAYNEKGELRLAQRSWENEGEGFDKRDTRKRIRGRSGCHGCRRYNVLRKYLLSQVGRPWADVWSDICRTMNPDDYTRGYIKMQVAENVFFGKDGLPYEEGHSAWRQGKLYEDVYVHPSTGVLCKTPKYPAKKKTAKQITYLTIKPDEVWVMDKTTKLWYCCNIKEIPKYKAPVYLNKKDRQVVWFYTTKHETVYDVFLKYNITNGNNHGAYGWKKSNFFCWRKRQLNKRELVALKKKLALVSQG